jgi:hypothetical protein
VRIFSSGRAVRVISGSWYGQYVRFALAVVGVDDSISGDGEVISTWQVWSSG